MRHFILAAAMAVLAPAAQAATTVLLDLNDFFADPEVMVSVDGTTATLFESDSSSFVLLANDPGLGDPNIVLPSSGTTLSFDYDFSELGSGADDEFGAFLLDGTTGLSLGAPFEVFFNSSSSGTLSFSLDALVGQTLGLQFQLGALFSDLSYESTVTVSNLRLTTAMSVVPLPSAGLLLMGALFGAAAFGRRRTVAQA